jgi:hypothetical protein
VQYWRRQGRLLGRLDPPRALINAECSDYEPAGLRVEGDTLRAGDEPLVTLREPAALTQALRVARHHHQLCVVGKWSNLDDPPAITYWQ